MLLLLLQLPSLLAQRAAGPSEARLSGSLNLCLRARGGRVLSWMLLDYKSLVAAEERHSPGSSWIWDPEMRGPQGAGG